MPEALGTQICPRTVRTGEALLTDADVPAICLEQRVPTVDEVQTHEQVLESGIPV